VRGYPEEKLDAWRAIEQLPMNQRAVLVLFYYHRLTISEIARLLNVSENTLRKRLRRALAKIRKTLSSESEDAQNRQGSSWTGVTGGSRRDE
jgi:RNA polymerase sigma-70 factor (ECF subfamily)